MAKYTLIRVYEIPADNKRQAYDRWIEATFYRAEQDFHVKDVLREPGSKPGEGTKVDLRPPAGWFSLLMEQLGFHNS